MTQEKRITSRKWKSPIKKFNICCFPTKNYLLLPIAISSEFPFVVELVLVAFFFLSHSFLSLHLFVNPFISLYIVQIVCVVFLCFAWTKMKEKKGKKCAILTNIVVLRMHFYADNYWVFMYENVHICRICSVSTTCTACGLFFCKRIVLCVSHRKCTNEFGACVHRQTYGRLQIYAAAHSTLCFVTFF